MILRKTAFAFILTANLVVLFHAVLPHHHHDQQICFNEIACCNHSGSAHHYCHGHGSQHDENGSTENCLLKQLVILPTNQERFKVDNLSINQVSQHADFYLASAYNHQAYLNHCTEFISLPDRYHDSGFAYLFFGLRAPPVA